MTIEFPCMQHSCNQKFNNEHMQRFCYRDIHLRRNLESEIFVAKHKHLKMCPRPGCNRAVIKPLCCYEFDFSQIVYCNCGTAVCFKCGNPEHAGNCTVGAFRFAVWRYFHHVGRCPNCTIPTSRYNLCNDSLITCLVCKEKWCWVCRRIVKEPPLNQEQPHA